MDITLTDEQQRMQESAREFLESEGGMELARRRMDGDTEVVDELWSAFAELDYTAITVPLEHDGFGEGMVYLLVLLEEIGRFLAPGPLPETTAFAVPLLTELGTEAQRDRYLPAIANGELSFSFALYDDESKPLPESLRSTAERLDGGAYRLDGTKTLVPYGGEVDRVVVAARTRDSTGYDGLSLFVVDPNESAVEARELDSLDRTRPMYELSFDELTVDESQRLGSAHIGGNALRDAIDRYTLARCAMLVGAADRAVDLSAEYGSERHQYGQPIGRFQAVKHRIVDMWIDMESTRSLVYYAAWAVDADEPDASSAISSTKAYAADRLHRAFGDDIWNHGGMGYTWDHDGHIYLKHAKALRNFLGSPEEHRDRLVETWITADDGI